MNTIDEFMPVLAAAEENSAPAGGAYGADFALAQEAARGDAEAFEKIYWQHHQRVFGICYRMTRNVSESEDLTQQVFIHLYRKIGSFRGGAALGTWLHRLTVNLVLMHFRKSRALREETTGDGTLPEGAGIGGRARAGGSVVSRLLIDEAIRRLPRGYRRILVLHDVCGFEHEEIARLLDCSTGTSKSQLFKARRKLRKLLVGGDEILKAS